MNFDRQIEQEAEETYPYPDISKQMAFIAGANSKAVQDFYNRFINFLMWEKWKPTEGGRFFKREKPTFPPTKENEYKTFDELLTEYKKGA